MAEISIDKSEFPDLQGCKVGDTYTLTGTATAVNGTELTLDITAAEPAPEDESAAEDASAGEESDMPAKSSKGPPRAIVAIGIPGGRKGY
jgi:hypothetical protein